MATRKKNKPNYGTIRDTNSNSADDTEIDQPNDLSNSYNDHEILNPNEVINQTYCKCSYVIEPVLLIQSIASSIISISYSQFIYTRLLNRLLLNNSTLNYIPLDNSTRSYSMHYGILSSSDMCNTTGNSSDNMDAIRLKAQEASANILFYCGLYGGLPAIFSTNWLGVNCRKLGRKTLLVFSLVVMIIRNIIFVNQAIFPDLPDYLFYISSVIDGLCGGNQLYYLVLYCYIADVTPYKTRSYRLTVINYLSSLTYICVSYGTGYSIEFFGYIYVFGASLGFYSIALLYTMVFVPEPLSSLRAMTLYARLKSCSTKRITNSFKVFTRTVHPVQQIRSDGFLDSSEVKITAKKRQRAILILLVAANVVYIFGASGIGSIFVLFLMNAPLCWDSIYISVFNVYSTVTSLACSLIVSRYFHINEILICILSIMTNLASSIIYGFTSDIWTVYIACTVGVLSGLEFGYVRSIVSKLVTKNEVSDSLTFIACIDTVSSVISVILSTFLYGHLVSYMVRLMFFIVPGIFSVAIVLHLFALRLYMKYKADCNSSPCEMVQENEVLIDNEINYSNPDRMTDTASIISSSQHAYEAFFSSSESVRNADDENESNSLSLNKD